MRLLKYAFVTIVVFFLIFILFYKFWFLRNPLRQTPIDPNNFISPANGKIVQILEWDESTIPVIKKHYKAFETFTNDVAMEGYLISIMMTPLDVHYQKASTNAKLINQKYTKWNFFNALSESKLNDVIFENERNEMLFETENNLKYKIIQIAGKMARRIYPILSTWDIVQQWQIIWLIKLGSQVTIVLPKNWIELKSKIWDYVIDGETILAKIEEK